MIRRWYLAGAILLAVVCVLCIGLLIMPETKSISPAESRIAAELSAGTANQIEGSDKDNSRKTGSEADTEGKRANGIREAEGEAEPNAAEGSGGEAGTYTSPVDFEALWEVNPDIYAWLYIPGTEINYPLLQREGDGAYYLNHNSECAEDKNGALFTESQYNNRDFNDPATAVYGHHMRSGAMFGRLQARYSEEGGLERYRDILVYLPDQEQHYEAFAALPFENDHILYYYDFKQTDDFQAFLNRVNSVRRIGASISQEIQVTTEDQILILSTCLSGNNQKRYLVLARRTEDKN